MSDSTPPSARSQRVTSGPNKNNHGDSQRSALQGASVAFRTPQPSPMPTSNSYSGPNAAARAAYVAGMGSQRAGVDTGNPRKLIVIPKPSADQSRTPPTVLTGRSVPAGSVENLEFPAKIASNQHQSPSYIAATLAAAKSSPATPILPGSPRLNPRRVTSSHFPSATLSPNLDNTPATQTLVKLFESKNVSGGVRATEILPGVAHCVLPIASPNPVRPSVPTRLSSRTPTWVEGQVPNGSSKSPHHYYTDPPQVSSWYNNEANPSTRSAYPSESDISGKSKARPKTPLNLPPSHHSINDPLDKFVSQKQGTDRPKALSDSGSSSSSYASAHDCPPGKLLPATSNQEQIVHFDNRTPAISSATVYQLPTTKPSLARSRSSLQSNLASKRGTSPSYLTSQLTVDSLANAIVASSLAASRASSPTKLGPPLPPKRHPKHPSLFRHNYANDHATSREHSPGKVLRHTMRDLQRPEDEDERVRKSHILNKHPNKHAEGDRKRWRDQITERERKRYEGLWAANRGLLIPDTEPQDSVSSLVVREIWARSQLSSITLAEVWDLVDTQQVGRLFREEFVVGMWLVDQCLKGRKLPVKVSESVWSSVRRLNGIKIPQVRR